MTRPRSLSPHQDLKKGGPRRRGFVITDARGEQTVLPFTSSGTLPGSVLPAHAPTHQFGGTDPVKLDDLATPDDNTDLNATTTRHGLLPKLSGDPDTFLNGEGEFVVISSEAGWLPMTTGAEPMEFVSDGDGNPVLIWYTP